eukprot:TRINITY_DN27726_c0_g1_i2.p1 TRINITY_DN27726_c0_g1~~TRINITY_DN27726_c0_g1_i2.p1  ORF type:complete len:712 (-),score=115.18 TRINITY_DN27726_c0_g1_i2:330-2465(-)
MASERSPQCSDDEGPVSKPVQPVIPKGAAAHQLLHVLTIAAVASSETFKVEYGRRANTNYHEAGRGYWWTRWDGFSTGGGFQEVMLDSLCVLVVFVVVLHLCLKAVQQHAIMGDACALATHIIVVLVLVALCTADVVLFVGAGGARVSLPLIFFVMSELSYALSVVEPWLNSMMVGIVILVVPLLAGGTAFFRFLCRRSRVIAVPWYVPLALLIVCTARLLYFSPRLQHGAPSGSDMLSQLSVDAVGLLRGALPDSRQENEVMLHRTEVQTKLKQFPPLLFFHWEAGSQFALAQQLASHCSALPHLCELLQREDARADEMVTTVPMTLKTSWEILCGTPPAITSDFREHGSALRRQCLPRVLASCCNYTSILAKTDVNLPQLPKTVFGFDEVIVADDDAALLNSLRRRLGELGALDGERPVFVYFYANHAHAPYPPDAVAESERGHSAHPIEDVFFALHRRTDNVARQLAAFWPPPMAPGAAEWTSRNGFSAYFGDHGEELFEDAPAHGNSLDEKVTRAFVVSEQRAFRRAGPTPQGLRRPADLYNTVLDLVSVRAQGSLHLGKSLFEDGHANLTSYSFYRPDERVAIHSSKSSTKNSGDAASGITQFARGTGGVWTIDPATAVECGDDSDSCRDVWVQEKLDTALGQRAHINRVMTSSNVHAAWLVARAAVAAERVKKVILEAARFLKAMARGTLLTCSSQQDARCVPRL